MKKSIMGAALLLPALLACTAGEAQNINADKVPAAAKTAFSIRFPKAESAKWELEDGKDYEANFKEAGTERSATFDASGKWLETETEIKAGQLPAAVTKAIAAGYADRKMKEAERVETPDRGVLYEVELIKGEDILEVQFNAEGKVLGAKTENEKDTDKEDND